MSYTQQDRPIQLETTLGRDVLLLERFEGREAISQPFEFHLHCVSTQKSLPIESMLRKPATLSIRLYDKTYRTINGLVRGARQLELDMGLTTYQVELVPWFWFLTQVTNCRIFQNKNVQQIVEQVFRDRGFQDFRFNLNRSYEERKFCVQYRETDFNFVSRMLEEEGIFYFWEQTSGKHTMVLTDSPAGIKPCPKQGTFKFAYQIQPDHFEDYIHTLDYERSYRTGKIAATDFDFKKPSTNLFTSVSGEFAQAEKYDYPGLYWETGLGNKRVKDWLEMEEWPKNLIRGISSGRVLTPGYKIALKEHFRGDLNKDYLLLAVYHRAEGNNFRSELEEPFRYSNTFEAMPNSIPYRPPRVAVKPTIKGTQTAIVVGPRGEEIYVDEFGRVKVQFHWDREGKYDEKSSCWIRVSAAWAGKAWGWITIPRIGQEVVVSFMEGDPDRPMITGRVYNAEQVVPYKLPDHKTQSTWKSRSSMKGGPSNFNEIRYEDLKGKEQLFIHAEFDRDDRTKRDAREYIGRDRHMIVKENQYEQVGTNREMEVKSDSKEKVGNKSSLTVGTAYHIKVGQNTAIDSGMEVHIKGGMKVIIEAGMQATLKGPGGFVNIDPSGVQIQGTMVLINSGGAAGTGSGSSPDTPKQPDTADDGSKVTKLN